MPDNILSFRDRIPQPATQKPLKATLFGASVMDMIHSTLKGLLAAEEGSISLENEAISGNKSFDGLERLQRVAESDADIVVVSFGGNDIRHGFSVESIHENLSTIIRTLQAHGKEVVLVGIDPKDLMHILQEGLPESNLLDAEDNPAHEFFDSIRNLYQSIQKEFGVRTFKPSMHSGLMRADLEEDGIHPNDSGIVKIAQDICAHVQNAAAHVRASQRIAVTSTESTSLQR